MTNTKKAPVAQTGLSKPVKIAIWIAAIVLVAALAFGIVWTSIDHSYRYDKEDLSVFLKGGADVAIDYDGLKSLPITLETTVTRDAWLKKIYTNMTSLEGVDSYKKKDANLSGINLPYPDIAYMYYEIFVASDAEGTLEDATPILANTSYYDAAKAKEVRLGNGDLHTLIENYMRQFPEYSTTVIRNEDAGDAIVPGYTLVVNLTATYETTTEKDGETVTSTSKYLTLTDYNIDLGDEAAIAEKKNAGNDGISYYVGTTTFKDIITEVKDHKVPAEVSDALLAEFAKLTTNATNAATGDTGKFEKTIDIKLGSDNEVTTVTFKGEVKANFLAEVKVQTFKLSEQKTLNEAQDGWISGTAVDFEYKDASGTTQKVDRNKYLLLRVTVESVLSLDEQMVTALTEGKDDFVAPTEYAEGKKDAAYALEYMEYVKKTMQNEAIAKMKEDANIASLTGSVKDALWKAITDTYANDLYVVSFPEGEIERYCDALMESYKYDYANSGLTSTYANVKEYVLIKLFEVSGVSSMTAAEQDAKLDDLLTEKAEEALRKEILLFWLANHYGVEITRADRKNAEDEVYNIYYSTYQQLYTSYYSTVYTAADIARLARQDAKAQADAICTPAYLREYVALSEVQDILVSQEDAKNYTNVTWVFSGEGDAE